MTTFVQLHMLTAYHPSNLNRDDLGRPKTAMMGGRTRLRISSQSLKRAWRTSEVFEQALDGHIGTRTRSLGPSLYDDLVQGGVSEKKALAWAAEIAGQFGKLKKSKPKEREELEIEQLVHVSPREQAAANALIEVLIAEERAPTDAELSLLRRDHAAVDIAMFGRMVAAKPLYNVEAAVQVAHALTTHEARVEDDYFSAVDDLNTGETSAGAAHIGQIEFGAGVFYLYLCVDRDLLLYNLEGDVDLAERALKALVKTAATVAPTGKQNSFASRARASYILAERGTDQPRALSAAFLGRLRRDADQMTASIDALTSMRESMDAAYGACADVYQTMRVGGEGSLEEVLDFASEMGS